MAPTYRSIKQLSLLFKGRRYKRGTSHEINQAQFPSPDQLVLHIIVGWIFAMFTNCTWSPRVAFPTEVKMDPQLDRNEFATPTWWTRYFSLTIRQNDLQQATFPIVSTHLNKRGMVTNKAFYLLFTDCTWPQIRDEYATPTWWSSVHRVYNRRLSRHAVLILIKRGMVTNRAFYLLFTDCTWPQKRDESATPTWWSSVNMILRLTETRYISATC